MMKNTIYYKQARLLLKLLPIIYKEKALALKGGTVINLFFRDAPRLSVDVDLTYLPIMDRESSLQEISDILKRISENIAKLYPNTSINKRKLNNTKYLSGLIVQERGIIVKIEVNTTFRGAVNPPIEISLSEKASELFEMDVTVQSLSFEDVYAGKICAALDRQHPRDFFDVKLLLENEGISDNLRRTFLVYLISNNRPIVELLNPNRIDITNIYNQEFVGMTSGSIALSELLESRDRLIKTVQSSLTKNEIEFLLSFKKKTPNWNLIPIDGIKDLPSVRWKMLNLEQMSEAKHIEAYNKLERFLTELF